MGNVLYIVCNLRNARIILSYLSLSLLFLPHKSYKQELPSRCKKEVLKAATRGRNDSVITIDAIEKLLINIGAEDKVSRKDVEIILSEVGESESNSGAIHIDQMM